MVVGYYRGIGEIGLCGRELCFMLFNEVEFARPQTVHSRLLEEFFNSFVCRICTL
jgi:hypothetical protein